MYCSGSIKVKKMSFEVYVVARFFLSIPDFASFPCVFTNSHACLSVDTE